MAMTPRAVKRRGLAAAFVAVMGVALTLLVAPATPATAATTFSDVPATHQFAKEISWLAGEGITTGYADGTFKPKAEVSREAFAAFLYRLSGRPSVSLPSKSPFMDVPTSSQFYREIVWLSKQGITTGWADGTFRPKNTIDRDAMAAFLYRYEGSPSFSSPKTSPFKDMSTSSKFYKEVTWLRSTGITTGYADGTFRPKSGVSREATAAFLYRLSGSPSVKPLIPTSFTVKGAGYGHGVGMSQYGAQAMALDGKSASDILKYYYKGTSVSQVEASKDLAVQVYGKGTDWTSSVTLVVRSPGSDTTDDGQWVMRFYNSGSSSPHTTWTGKNNEYLHITRSGTSITVERDGGQKVTATKDISLQWESTSYYQSGSSEDVYVDIYKGTGASKIPATHGTYRHGKMLISVPASRLNIVNVLDLNTEYMYGIAEMPSSWDTDALQAQAIVARGYAVRALNGGIDSSCDCNIVDDTSDQNFAGWSKENEGTNAYYGKRWVSAVNATVSGTKGKVLTSGGSIARTYYFSSSGGQTENSEDIWSATLSYLRSTDDPWSETSINPNRSWTQTLSQTTAKSVFGLSDVVSIKVTGRTAGGSDAAATKVTATSSAGKTSTITGAESIRSKLANGKSPWLWSFTANY
ncbi:SpoIID/LytB domain-containing protein [Demequina sp. NBRC 110051]|uniref:SpoIID/LytB domain-containing protein n=1 Tax=Demequina sp. NBRC 110051 TaxID=1570340 RepID=UPI0009FF8480|nr:SpoIID/LytB domain-containing protein [Demequina sp. NBRC 110051]